MSEQAVPIKVSDIRQGRVFIDKLGYKNEVLSVDEKWLTWTDGIGVNECHIGSFVSYMNTLQATIQHKNP